MDTLKVYLSGNVVGHLTRTRNGATFQYVEGLKLNKPLLSASLPVKAPKYKEGLTGNWFIGLLPEDHRLDKVARQLGVDKTDYFSILAKLGNECAGAVQIVEELEQSDVQPLEQWSTKSLREELLSEMSQIGRGAMPTRMSIGGFQDKLLVVAQDGEFYKPDNNTVSTHILKPEKAQYPGSAEAEAWACTVASYATAASEASVLDFDGLPVLCSKRFDRKSVGSDLRRIHQEDFCQAMGLPIENKYANEREIKGDDPTYIRAANLLFSYSVDPISQLKILAQQVVVNLCLGNNDAHAKNYSFLHDADSNISVAPMYDVVPTREILQNDIYLSMRINNKIIADEIRRGDLLKEFTSWGLPNKMSTDVLDSALANLFQGIKKVNRIYKNAAQRHSAPSVLRIKSLQV